MTESTPICRCRVLYLGSSVPQQTKDGLQGIQEPLQELYPDQGATGARGIDSWLSVWSNGILLENVDENHKKITRFFPIESLHYCAAVRYVLVPEKNTLHSPSPRFLPLDSPFARAPNPTHPPLFAAILRRTTGIKVLECHAFICKREVAANALVRCCFHAYADSSYAKQVDTAGSIYGTLASERLTNKDKVEEWKQMTRSTSGSTMTINTIGNSNHTLNNTNGSGGAKDDVSIYNGDENHKVWAGSQDNLDAIYDVYSTSTIGRPSRPRQIAQPVAIPPPPMIKDASGKNKKNKNKHQQAKSLSASREDLYHPLMNGGGGKANSIAGGSKLGPPRGPPPPQPMYIMAPPPHMHPPHMHQQTLPNPKFFKHHGNTFSHRPRGRVLIPARPIPPPLVPMTPVMIPTTTMTKTKKKSKHTVEEPIYMPSNRALSPVASYQPVNFPHEAYLMQHYATMESQGKQKRREKNGNSKMSKKLAQSMNGLDDPNLGPPPPIIMNGNGMGNGTGGGGGGGGVNGAGGGDESPFNTGIYRKKGHLNERAFSYSIRQEHRSRSYGSLANLKFASPIPNGDVEDREDIKKEREIMQMVQDLDLSGDELERSEVPRNMYDARGPPPAPVIVGAPPPMMNGGGRNHRR